jgi:lipopolysaccharide export LptBFGC system permease protein LptF
MGLAQSPSMLIFAIPQAIPLAIPVGLTVGILWALGWSGVSRRVAAFTVAIALALSAVSLVTLAWVVPEANQAYRVARGGPGVARGVREMPMRKLGRMLAAPETIPAGMRRGVAWTYHQYWAVAFAPAALTLFALSAARRRFRARWRIGFTAAGAVWGYYALMWGVRGAGLDLTWSPLAAAWLANAAFVVLALILLMRRPSMNTLAR